MFKKAIMETLPIKKRPQQHIYPLIAVAVRSIRQPGSSFHRIEST
jgi:hypothetical protein